MPDQPSEPTPLWRVVIVEDHRLVADSLAALLDAEPDLAAAGVATRVADALAVIRRSDPDVVICDIQLGEESGFSVLEAAGAGGPAFVMYSSHDHPSYARAAFEGGALGFVLKQASSAELLAAVRAAAAGRSSFGAEALRDVRSARAAPTDRQLEIIELIAAGRSNDQISADLSVAPKTVESHLRTLFDRYAVGTRTELVLRAISEGWIRPRDRRHSTSRLDTGPGDWFADTAVTSDRSAGPADREGPGRR